MLLGSAYALTESLIYVEEPSRTLLVQGPVPGIDPDMGVGHEMGFGRSGERRNGQERGETGRAVR